MVEKYTRVITCLNEPIYLLVSWSQEKRRFENNAAHFVPYQQHPTPLSASLVFYGGGVNYPFNFGVGIHDVI